MYRVTISVRILPFFNYYFQTDNNTKNGFTIPMFKFAISNSPRLDYRKRMKFFFRVIYAARGNNEKNLFFKEHSER